MLGDELITFSSPVEVLGLWTRLHIPNTGDPAVQARALVAARGLGDSLTRQQWLMLREGAAYMVDWIDEQHPKPGYLGPRELAALAATPSGMYAPTSADRIRQDVRLYSGGRLPDVGLAELQALAERALVERNGVSTDEPDDAGALVWLRTDAGDLRIRKALGRG